MNYIFDTLVVSIVSSAILLGPLVLKLQQTSTGKRTRLETFQQYDSGEELTFCLKLAKPKFPLNKVKNETKTLRLYK